MFDWLYRNELLVEWLLLVSVVFFIIELFAVPVILAKLPSDYFSQPDRHYDIRLKRFSIGRLVVFLIRNLIGAVLVFFGILMLVLPGQGILTIVIGLVLAEFPGKYQIERWIITRPVVFNLVNWARTTLKKPKFKIEPTQVSTKAG